MKKFAKVCGQFLTDGNFNKVRVTKREAVAAAKRTSKRVGIESCGMHYHVNEHDDFFSVVVHTGVVARE